jgi:hypothetical protein
MSNKKEWYKLAMNGIFEYGTELVQTIYSISVSTRSNKKMFLIIFPLSLYEFRRGKKTVKTRFLFFFFFFWQACKSQQYFTIQKKGVFFSNSDLKVTRQKNGVEKIVDEGILKG